MRVRSLSLVTIAMLLAGLFPAGVGGVRAASPVLVDPDPQNYTIAVQGGGLVPEHTVCGLNLDPQHTSYCGGGYGYPAKYGVQYGYPSKYPTQYGYPPKYGTVYGYPTKYGTQYATYPTQYGYPAQYTAYPADYQTPATLPDSTIACVTSPSGAAVVVGALMTCTAKNTFFSSTTNDGTVSISGGATLSGTATVSTNTISFSVALNSAATATIAVTYTADTSGNNVEKHEAATHYLNTINGSATGIASGVFTITGDSVSISGLDPMSVWLAGDTLGQDTVTVTSASKDAVTVTLTGCSTASGSDVLSASVASGATLLVYGRAAGTCAVTGAVNGASTTVSTTVSLRAASAPVSQTGNTAEGAASGSPSLTTIHDIDDTVDSSLAATTAGATVSYSLVSGSSTAGLCSLNTSTGSLAFNLGVISGDTVGVCVVRATQTATATHAGWTQDATRSARLHTPLLSGFPLSRTPSTGTVAAGSSFTAAYAGTTYGLLTWQTSGPCNSLSTSPTATINVTAGGSCAVSLYDSGNGIYKAATSATMNVTTSDASQTISFTEPESPSSAVTATLSATASSGLAVTFSASPSSVCSVSGNTVTYLAAGNCTISANQTGGVRGGITYSAATTVNRTVAVTAEPQVISFANLPTGLSVADGSFTISVSVSSGLTATVVSDTEAVCTISGSTVTILVAGTCTLTASRAGATVAQVRYAAAPDVTKSTTIIKADQVAPTITVAAGPYTAGTTKSATVAGGTAAGTRSWTLSGACSGSNTAIVLNTAGACVISVSYAGTADYNSVTASTTITVIAANQTISFTAPASPVNIGTSADLSATASSGLAVTFSTSTTSICSISVATVSYEAAGTCSITAAQAGNTVYGAATNVTRTVTVNASAQTISASGDATWTGASRVLGSTATLTATASSGLAVSAESTTASVCTISSGNSPWTVTFVGLGACSVTFTRAGGVNAGTTYLAAEPETLTSTVAAIPAPTVSSPNAIFSVDPDDVARASSVVQMTNPSTLTNGAYGSSGSLTIAFVCGSQGGASLIDEIEFTRILSIDGDTRSAVGRADCTDESYTVSGLSNGSYAISARAVAGSTKSAAVSVGSIVVGAAPTVSINAISGATDGGSLSYLKTLTPTLSWSLESGDVMTGQTLVRYSATPTAEGVCPAGAALGSATAAAGWTPDITFASGTTPATLATGDRSKSFANNALPERCVQFGHTGVNGAFSATIWSQIYLVDVTKPSLTPAISGTLEGVAQTCATVSVQSCRIEPGAATVSVIASDAAASGVPGSGVVSVQLRGSGFDTKPRPYATIANRSRNFTAPSDKSSMTLYATVRDRAGNSISIPISFSVAAATEPVFNAVVDLVDCTDTSVVIRPDFAEQGFLYWPVGAELCLVPRVDMAVKGYRYVNGVAQESVFIGTLTSKLTGAAASVADNARGKIGKWPTTKIDETFTHGEKPLSLREASDQYGSGVFLYEKIAAGTATDTEKALYRSSVLRFRIDAETSIDNADAAPYISIPLSFTYAYGWVNRNTTVPLRAYVTPKAVSITLRVIAVNLGAGQ
jgi:hypothetical protein